MTWPVPDTLMQRISRNRPAIHRPIERSFSEALLARWQSRFSDGVAEALRASKAFDDLPQELRARREEIVAALTSGMPVIVSKRPDPLAITSKHTDQAWLQSQEATGIHPRFAKL